MRVSAAPVLTDTMKVMEAVFFDLDKTIISRSSSLALSRPMYRAGMVTRGQLVRGAYAQLVYALVGADEKKMDRLKEGMLQLTRGWDRHEVESLVEEVLIEVIDPFVYQEALDLMEEKKTIGFVFTHDERFRSGGRYYGGYYGARSGRAAKAPGR